LSLQHHRKQISSANTLNTF